MLQRVRWLSGFVSINRIESSKTDRILKHSECSAVLVKSSTMSNVNMNRLRSKKVPPEGGYGFVVMLGVAIPLGFCQGAFICFGLMFNDFLTSIGAETSSVTLIMGILNFAMCVGGLFAGTLNKIYSVRFTALLGAAFFFGGSMMSVVVTSVEHLIVSYGLLLGIGMGLMIPSAYSTFNEYFVKKRVLMMSIAQSITGVILMFYPIVVQNLMNTFGFRGGLAMIAALNAHVILGMLAMHPVEWHYKVIQVPIEEEVQPFINTNDTKIGEMHTVACTNEVESEGNKNLSGDAINADSREQKTDANSRSMISVQNDATENNTSIISVIDSNATIKKRQTMKQSKWQKTIDFLDLALFKDVVFMNILIGIFLVSYADDYFATLQPMYLFELHISKDDTALIMSILSGFDLGSRLFLSCMSLIITVKARYLYAFGTIASIISRTAFLHVHDFMGLAIVSATIGFFKSFMHLTKPLVVAEHLPKDKFASGYGLLMFIQGVLTFFFSPFIGWVRDATNSYVFCFNTLSIIMGLCIVLWLIELVWYRIYPRQSPRTSIELPNKT